MIKIVLTIVAFLSVVVAMEDTKLELSKQENECYQWYQGQKKHASAIYNLLSLQEQEKMKKGNSAELFNVFSRYVDLFFQHLPQSEREEQGQYTSDELLSTLLKMREMIQRKQVAIPTDCTTAQMYVYSRILNAQEREALHAKNYKKDPKKTQDAVKHYSQALVKQLIELSIIVQENEEQEVEKHYQEKINEIKVAARYIAD